jgi:hypothetical protein
MRDQEDDEGGEEAGEEQEPCLHCEFLLCSALLSSVIQIY